MWALVALPGLAAADLTPSRLRCEYLDNPLGIDVRVPRLSWIVESSERGATQRAYRIVVASTPALLKSGKGDLWDSGKVASKQTTQVEYMGKPLQSSQQAFWKVTVWDADGEKTSRPATWEMGLLSQSEWKGKWLSLPDTFARPNAINDSKWIWYPEGNPAQTAPPGERRFQYQFDLPSSAVKSAFLGLAVDDHFTLKINGKEIAASGGWTQFTVYNVKDALKSGTNSIEIIAINDSSRSGVLVAGEIVTADGKKTSITSGKDWQASKDGSQWVPSMELASFGGAPYGSTTWSTAPKEAAYVRREVAVTGKVKRVRAYVTAKGLYNLYVDGKKVGHDALRPGWTEYTKRIQYQTYDLTSQFKSGKHAVGMVLGDGWYSGHVGLTGRGSNYGTKPMGLAQIDIEYADGHHEVVSTDADWQVGTGPIVADDLLMGEDYDAQRELPGWAKAGFTGKWAAPEVTALGDIPLVAQMTPSVRKIEELKPKAITQPKPKVFVYDMAQNMVGWARLNVKGPKGTKVQLRFAEMLNPDGTIYTTNLRGAKATDTYTLSGNGKEVYEPSFTFHGFRYVEVTGYPGTPGKDAITGVVASTDNPQTGTFACSSDLVNQLQHNIYWGQRGNYLEVPTDCPQRDERLGWMGDAQIFAPTACLNNDVAAFLTKYSLDTVDAQSPEGGFSDVTPRIGDWSDGAPAWGDAGVIVPWTVYRAYGDLRILRNQYPAMKKWVDYIDSANPNHIWVNRANNNFGDWLNANDDTPRDVIGTAYFARSCDLLARSARLLGNTEDAAKYGALLMNIKQAFNAKFVDADVKIKGDTQTDYVLALEFDLIPDSQRAAAGKRLAGHIMIDRKGHLSTGFVGVGGLNPSLTAVGRTDVAYKLLLNDTYPSWGYSIRQGATTIWERWDGWTQEKGFQDPGMNSFNHYSLGSVGQWMYETVAGIAQDPTVAGYEKIVIHPIPGGEMKWAKGTFDSIHGRIESGWRTKGSGFELNVTIPANTTATVYVPAASADKVMEGAGLARDAEGIRFLRMEGDSAVFTVGSGTYHFTSTRK